eukprot:3528152-Rhodomonas_salina.1
MLFADGGVAHYAILEHTDGQTEQWGQLMQSIAVDLWRLKEPKVLISVTGGAEDFAMSRVDNEQLMQVSRWGRNMEAVNFAEMWKPSSSTTGRRVVVRKANLYLCASERVCTAGSDASGHRDECVVRDWRDRSRHHEAGWRRQVRAELCLHRCARPEAGCGGTRKQYAADAPLIGVASWDVLTGKEEIDKHKPGDELLPYQPLFGSAAAEQNKPVKLDSGHSHFFLIKGVKQDFGGEIDSRSAFEKRVGLGRDIAVPQNQLNRITNYNEWKDARDDGPRLPDSVNSEVPVVCVCVQGGPGTVSTVLGAVTNGTPALLVRGSGKAADLIAGAYPDPAPRVPLARVACQAGVDCRPLNTCCFRADIETCSMNAVDMILLRQNDDTAVSLSPRQDRLGKFLFTENQTQGKASGEKGVKSFRQDVPKIVQELKDLGWGNEKHPHPVCLRVFSSRLERVVHASPSNHRSRSRKAHPARTWPGFWSSTGELGIRTFSWHASRTGQWSLARVLFGVEWVYQAKVEMDDCKADASVGATGSQAFEDAMKAAQNPVRAVQIARCVWRGRFVLMQFGREQLCEVFELGGEVPFSDSLLECIVHGIDGSRGNDPPPGSGKPSRLERKLTLAVEFNNLAILKKQVQNRKTANDETAEQLAMDRALDTALCKQNRPDLVDYLVNNGAKVDGYNLKGVKSDKRAEAENRWKQLART